MFKIILNYTTAKDIKEAEKMQNKLYNKYNNVKVEAYGFNQIIIKAFN